MVFSRGQLVPYLDDVRMLKESRVTHESNIVYLQLKLLSTHVGFGGKDGGQDDVREPLGGKKRLSERCARGRMRRHGTEI